MSVNVSNLELKLIQKINSANTELEVLTYQKVLETLRTGSVDVVETYSELPETNTGKLYFVRDENTHYFFSTEYSVWVPLSETTPTQLWGWGVNTTGQLANNSEITTSSPVQEISVSIDWCHLNSSYNGDFNAIKTDGTLWASGSNSLGKLGDGTTINRSSPVQEISSSTDWCTSSIGTGSSSAIKTNGTLWNWGGNTYGNLGINSEVCYSSPIQEISSSTNWCYTCNADQITSALKTDGTLWSWGWNLCGVLGVGDVNFRSSPVQEVSSSTTWSSIGGKYRTRVATKTDGTLWLWGNNSFTQLGDGTIDNRSSPFQEETSSTTWCYADSNAYHSSGVKSDGTLWNWGRNQFGYLMKNDTLNRLTISQEFTSSTNWCNTTTLLNSTSAIKTDGSIWSAGLNSFGQLGDGTVICRSSPVQEITSSNNWSCLGGGGNAVHAIKTIQL